MNRIGNNLHSVSNLRKNSRFYLNFTWIVIPRDTSPRIISTEWAGIEVKDIYIYMCIFVHYIDRWKQVYNSFYLKMSFLLKLLSMFNLTFVTRKISFTLFTWFYLNVIRNFKINFDLISLTCTRRYAVGFIIVCSPSARYAG